VCNFASDNSGKARSVFEALIAHFKPERVGRQQIDRGVDGGHGGNGGNGGNTLEADALGGTWHDEALNPHSRYGYRLGRLLHEEQSAFQHIAVYESEQFGRLFLLDGDYMTSEQDEYYYHEALIHPAAITVGNPRSALILGGGDGGSCEELLKYPGMQRVVIAEIDEAVVRMARCFLGEVHRGALDDPRVELRIGNGFELAGQLRERFDLVILDLTDPDTPASALYSEAFFGDVGRLLEPQGALVLHTGTPVFASELVAQLQRRLRRHFAVVAPFGLYIPLYGSYWTLAVCSQSSDPRHVATPAIRERLSELKGPALRYYNAEIHPALFALPNDLRLLLAHPESAQPPALAPRRPDPTRPRA
jgi:spermidine synthase